MSVRRLSKPVRLPPSRFALEPRIVFDGAMPVAAAAVADHADNAAAAHPQAAERARTEHTNIERGAAPPAAIEARPAREQAPVVRSVDERDRGSVDPAPPASTSALEIAFVDDAVKDVESYLPGFKGVIVTLRPDQDGMDQIAAALAGRTGLSAIHIVSHGEAGELSLGNGVLDTAGITGRYAADVAAIKAALSAQGDLLLYGCDIAAGAQGQAFVQQLAQATSADVAASTDDTGAADLGGNWTLESHVGSIETQSLDGSGWEGVLAQTNTGTWTLGGIGNTTTATSTVGGITTTVSFGSFSTLTSGVGTFTTSGTGATLNNIAAFSPAVQNTPSLGFQFNWDTLPEGATTEASTDAGTGIITITFSQAVTNPIIHLDRIGGSDGFVQNGMRFTLVNPGGLSLTSLAGTPHFLVDSAAGTIQNSQIDVATGTGYSGESSLTANLGSAAGSVRVNGTVTSVQFVMSAAPNSNEGGGSDAIELKVTFDPTPVAVADSFATPHDTPITLNVRANDSDPQNDAITVTKVNGTAVTAGGAGVSVTGGTVALTVAGNLQFTPTAGYTGATSFTYAIADPAGGEATATVGGSITDVAPVVDLNSDSTATQRIVNGSFTGGATSWTTAGAGSAGSNVYFWDTDGGIGTLTQSGLTGLTSGYGTNGAAQVTYDLGWNNGNPDSTNAATLDLSIGGVVYARLTTNKDNANGPVASVTYLNGASGPVTSINSSAYLGWTYTNLVVNLPSNVAASGSLQFAFNANGGTDDIAIDNVSVLTRTDTVAGNDFSTSYIENGAPVSIAAATSEIRDNDGNVITAAAITLTNAQAGDLLSVIGTLPTGITASAYNPGNGAIILIGNATLAQYAAAIRQIGYSSTSDNPSTVNRTVNVFVNDGIQVSATSTTTITVTAVNDPPVVANDSFTGTEDTALSFDPRSNDSDPEGSALTITQVNGTPIGVDNIGVAVTGGVVVMNNNGTLTFVPNLNFNGASTFSYQVSDSSGATSTASVTLTINAVNDAPVVDLNGPTPTSTALVADGARDTTAPSNSWEVLLYGGLFGVAGTSSPNNADRMQNGSAGTPVVLGEIYLGQDDTALVFRDNLILAGEKAQNPLIRSGNQLGGTYAVNATNGDYNAANGTVFEYVARRTMTAAGTITLGQPGSAIDDFAEVFVNGVRVAQNLSFTYNLGAPLTASFAAGDLVEVRLGNQGGQAAFNLDVVISNVNFATSYVENGTPVSIASTSSSTSDVDGTNLVSASIVLTNAQAGDLLSLTSALPGGITASAYNASTGTITLSGSATAAQYNTAIRSIGYSSTSDNPSTVNRIVNVTVNDGTVASAVAVTTIAVTAVNDPPVANADSFTTNEDTTATINVRANDTDAEGDALTITQVNGTAIAVGGNGIDVTGGVVTLNASGNLVFTPTANFNGATSFTYTIADPSGATSTATVSGTIVPVDDAPVVNNNSNANLLIDGDFENTLQPVIDGNNLKGTTYGAFTSNASINVIHVDGNTYAAGPDRADSGVQYIDLQNDGTLSQSFTLSAAQTISFGAAFANRDLGQGGYVAPTTVVEILNAGGTVVATANALSLTRANGAESWFATSGTATLAAGTYTYRVTLGNFGHVDSVYVRTSPNYATSYTENAAPVSITASGNAVTDVDNANMVSATIVLTNAQAGDLLSVTATLPSGITASAYNAATGTITLTGSATRAAYATAISSIGFSSTSENPPSVTRTVNVTVNDGSANSNTAVTSITVIPVNDPPTAVNDSFTIAEDSGPVTINVRANDTDPENDPLTVTQVNGTAISAGGASVAVTGGTVALNASGNLVFTPTADYNGSPSFTYTIADPSGATSTATVNGTVTPVNDAPTSTAPASLTINEDTTVAFVGGNALTVNDVDGTPLTVTLTVTNGTLTMGTLTGLTFTAGDGTADATMTFSGTQAQLNAALASLSFAPTADYNGSATLGFSTTDGSLSVAKSTAITINPVADIVADAITTNEDTAVTFNAITGTNGASADNFENAGRVVSSVTQGAHGTVTFQADGTLTYTPAANYNGSDSFTYTVTSGGVTEKATVTMTIVAVNDAPTSVAPSSVTTAEDTTVAFSGGNALSVADIDSGNLTVTLTVTHGTLTMGTLTGLTFTAGDGTADATMTFSGTQAQLNAALASLSFAPTADYNGSAALTFSTSDGSLSTAKSVALTITPVADVVNDTVATNEDTAVTFNVLTGTNGASADNFEDPSRTVTSVTQGAHGTVTFQADGTLTYTPAADYNGSDSFTYTVTSGGVTETGTVTMNIASVNDAPTSTAPASLATNEDATLTFVGGNALTVNDVDGTPLTVTLTVTNGTLTMGTLTGLTFTAGDGTADATMTFSGTQAQLNAALASLSFAPTADYNGSATLGFSTTDGSLSVAKSTAITINPVADIVADAITTNEDTAVTFNAITGTNGASADNFENAGRVVSSVTQGAHGTVTFQADGTLTYTPAANYNGSDSFTYTVTSGGVTETATVTMTIVAVNDAPVAVNDSFTIAEDNVATINVRANDSDIDGDAITVTRVNGTAITAGGAGVAVTGGVVTLNASGNLVFTPTANYNGSPSFTYTIADPSGATSTATVNGTVTPVNDAPTAVNDSFTSNEDTTATINVRANDSDVDGDAITVTQVNGTTITVGGAGVAVTGGVVTLNASGNLVFTPTANYNGSTSFTYTIADPSGASSTATVSGTIVPVNDAPTAVNDSFTSNEDTTATINVRANDSDVDGDAITVTQVNGTAITAGGAGVAVTGGVVTLNASGNLVFTPTANYNGSTSFTYTVADPSGATSTATVSGTIVPVNDAPTAVNDSFTIAEDNFATINVRANDSDVDGDAITVTRVNGTAITAGGAGVAVTGGVVTLNASGNLVFTPTANYNGSPSFTYTIADPSGATSTATVNGTVTPVNDAPTAVNDSFTSNEDTTATINVRANDSDVDGDAITVTQVNGTTITVGGAGIAVTGGVVTLNASGNLVFTPTTNYNGSTSFTYTIADPSGATSTATVSGTIVPVNDAPVAVNDSGTVNEDSNVSGNTLANDTDVDGDTLTVTAVGGSAGNVATAVAGSNGGLFTIQANGSYVFATNGQFEELGAGQTRASSVTYAISDGHGGTASATVTVTVTGVNDAPVAVADSYDTVDTAGSPGGVPLSGNVLSNDSDAERGTLVVSAVNGSGANVGSTISGSYGTLRVASDGTFRYAVDRSNPAVVALLRGQALTESFTYQVSDGQGGFASTSLTIRIDGTNDSPEAGNDSNTLSQGQAQASGNVLTGTRTAGDGTTSTDPTAADSDPNGDPIRVDEIRTPAQATGASVAAGGSGTRVGQYGSITIDSAGNYVYTLDNNSAAVRALAPGQQVTETFVYTITDGASSVDATVTIVIGGTNDPPVAVNDSFVGSEDMPVVIEVRANDSDPDGDPIRVTQINGTAITAGGAGVAVTGGVVTLDASGTLLFTPNANYNGSPSFTYTISDPLGATATATVSGTITPVNDPPVAVDDRFTSNEDAVATIDVRANDTDPDGDVFTVTQVDGTAISAGGAGVAVTGGVVTLDAAGSLVFTPTANYNGSTSFTYTIADPSGATSMATVGGTIVPVNDAPTAVNDSFTIAEDNAATINVRANDSDVDGDAITVTQVNGTAITAGGAGVAVTGGVVTLNASGNLVFTPTANYNGSPSFTYTIADPSGATSTATVNGTVTPVNDAPTAVNDSFTSNEDTTATIDVRANDSDVDGDAITVTQVNGTAITVGGAGVAVTGGVVTLNASGNLVFTPTANYNGSTSFTYAIADPSGASSTATVGGTIVPVNDAPTAVNDSFTIAEDNVATINVRANDSDIDGDAITVTQVNGSAITVGGAGVAVTGGVVTLNVSGNLVFTPTANYNGSPSFSYTIADPSGATATATVNGTVTPVNDAPTAVNDSFTSNEDTTATIDVRANDSDVDGDAITVTQVNGTAITVGGAGVAVTGGVVTLNASGNLVFTPTANYNGSTSFTYTIADPSGATSTATVGGTIVPVNDAPTAVNDSFTIAEDTTATINVRSNDSDIDGDAINVTQVNGTAITAGGAGVAVTGGVVTLNASGNLVFTPTANYNGSPSFTYTIADPSGATATATVSGTVTPVNDAPTAVNDSFTSNEDTTATIDVRANDSDVDGDAITVRQVNGQNIVAGGIGIAVTGGTVTLNGAGNLVFTPTANFNGSTSFTYLVADPSGATSTATVSGTIVPVNDPPVANSDSFTVAEDNPATIDVRANDTDVDGDALTVTQVNGTAIAVGGAGVAVTGGVVTLNASGNLVFTPTANYNGSTSFTYTVADPSGATSTATVGGTITPVNDPPTAVADSFTTAEDTTATINARANDSDVDGDPVTITQVAGQAITAGGAGVAVTGGVVTLSNAGNLVFTPTANFNGSTSFTYTIADPSGATSTATVNGTVTPVNDPPTAVDDRFTSNEDTTATIDVRANDSDVDGDAITVTRVNGTAITSGGAGVAVTGGVVTLNASGNLVFTPTANYNGSTSFTYTIADPSGATSTATVSGTINPVNDPPIAVADNYTIAEDSVGTFNVLANDSDPDGDPISLIQVNGQSLAVGGPGVAVSGGVVTLDGANNLVFTPTANYNGPIAFSYTISDASGATATASVGGTVTPVNDAPVAANDRFTINEDTVATLDARANDSDVDGDPLTITQVDGTAVTAGGPGVAVTGGVVTLDGSGRLVFTPTANYNGSTSFTYTIADPSGATSTATVDGTIVPVNDPPVAVDDRFTVAEDNAATINVRANDSDVEGDRLTVIQVDGTSIAIGGAGVVVTGGVVTLDGAGNLVFTPNANYNGSPSFTYTIADPSGATATATVVGTVTPVNDLPVAVDDAATVNEDSSTTGHAVANDTDADNDPLTVVAVGGNAGNVAASVAGSNGGLFTVQSDGSYAFASNGQFEDLGTGQSRASSVTYTVSDGHGGTATATITVTVTGVNDAPVAVADAYDTVDTAGSPGGTPLSGSVLLNDSDAEHATLVVTTVDGSAANVGSAFATTYGTLQVAANGSFSYAVDRTNPAVTALLRGQSLSETFTYRIADGQGGFADSTLSIRIDGTNDSPDAGNDGNGMLQGQVQASGNVISGVRTAGDGTTTTDPTAADSDPNGDPIRVNEIRRPADATGSGIASGGSGTRIGQYGSITIDSAGNYVYTLDNGNAALLALGTGQQVTETFVYTITDGASSVDATITIVIGGTNDNPVAVNDSGSTLADSNTSGNVLTNDSDPDVGQTLAVSAVGGVAGNVARPVAGSAGGLFTVQADGTYAFTPNGDFVGVAAGRTRATSVTYTVGDGQGGFATATLTVTVTGLNDAPTAVDDAFTMAEDSGSVTIAVRANDVDPDGDPLTVTQVDGTPITAGGPAIAVAGGTVVLTTGGNLVYTPDRDYNGSPSFRYTVADPSGATSDAFVIGRVTPVNDAPVASNDAFTVNEDTIATIAVRANDVDVDGDPLTVTQVNGTAITAGGAGVAVTGGVVTLDGNGNLVFTPTANYNGGTSFAYTVADPSGATSTATVTGAIVPVNDRPVANADRFTIAEDTVATLDVRANDTDADGDPLTVTQINGQAIAINGPGVAVGGGVVTLNGAGNVVFTPTANFAGSPSFSYTVSDPSGATSVATVSGTVTPVDDAPVANNDSFTAVEDTPITFDVRANDTDAEGDPLTVTRINGTAIVAGGAGVAVTGGVVTLNGAGNVVFTPAADYDGPVSFGYTVADPSGATGTATVSGTVTPVNDAPVARPDTASTPLNTPVTIAVLANDSDVDGPLDPASVQLVGTAQPGDPLVVAGQGTWTIDRSNGSITFTPVAGFIGVATTVDYSVADTFGLRSTPTTLSVTVTTANRPPVAVADRFTAIEDTPLVIDVRGNDSDPDGDPLTVTRIDGTAIVAGGPGVAVTGGVVTLNAAGNLVFTPGADYNGAVAFGYTVADPSGATSTASVAGTVTPVNDAPVAVDDAFTIAEDTVATIDVRTNDRDVDGDPLTVTRIDGTPIAIGGAGVAVTGGVVTLDATGRLVFTPTANFNGSPSFTYTVADPSGATSTGTVRGTVTPVNDAPVANADRFVVAEDTPLTFDVRANDTDVDGDPLTVTRINGTAIVAGGPGVAVTGGVVTLNAAGNLVFTPGADYNGAVAFGYTVADPSGATSSTLVSGTVTPVNDAPVAVDDAFTIAEDTVATIDVRTNDRDVDGDPLTVTRIDGTPIAIGGAGVAVTGGVVTLDATGRLVFTPTANFNGSPSFTYTVADPSGATSTGTVRGTVTPVNDAPVANADRFVVAEDTPFTFDVRANDTDVDGDPLTVTRIDGTAIVAGGPGVAVTGGVVTLNAAGNLVFTPAADYNGPASFSYTVADPSGATATASVAGTVTPVNDAPVAVGDTFVVDEDTPVTIDVLANDRDVDGDRLVVGRVNGVAIASGGPGIAVVGGVVTLDGAGRLVFTPSADFNGTVSFSYTAVDPSGAASTATVGGTVRPVNDAPVAVADRAIGDAGTPLLIDVLGNDRDVDGDRLTVTAIDGVPLVAGGAGVPVAGGVVTLDASGRLRYTPAIGNTGGTITFSYTARDPSGATSSADVTLVLDPVSRLPVGGPAGPFAGPSFASGALPPSIDPELFVLESVSDASSQFALRGAVGTLPADAATTAEIASGLRDDLGFAAGSAAQPVGLIARDADLFRDGVRQQADTLFVQHAVRHEGFADPQALYVQAAVRQSQREAQLLELRANGINSAATGTSTLLDPFALGAPVVPARPQAEPAAAKPAPAKRAEDTTRSVADGRGDHVPLDALAPRSAPVRDASGFSMQLRQSASRLHARTPTTDRPVAFVVPRDKGTAVAARHPATGDAPAPQ